MNIKNTDMKVKCKETGFLCVCRIRVLSRIRIRVLMTLYSQSVLSSV